MSFEYAASWPREAERSLNAYKERLSRFLPGKREFSDEEVWLDHKPAGQGYSYRIKIADSVKAEIAREIERRRGNLYPFVLKHFEAVMAASDAGCFSISDQDNVVYWEDDSGRELGRFECPYQQADLLLAIRPLWREYANLFD